MPETPRSAVLRVSGMVCRSCEEKIGKRLSAEPGVSRAVPNYKRNSLGLSFHPGSVSLERIISILDEMGYDAAELPPGEPGEGDGGRRRDVFRAAALILILSGLYLLAGRYGLWDFLNVFPEAEAGMGLGMIFVVGLLTSTHCLAMCGGINLSQTALAGAGGGKASLFLPTLLYGAGRTSSYALIGAAAGGLGSAISFSAGAKGLVQMAAGLFMMLMGLSLSGLFPWARTLLPRLPGFLSGRVSGSSSRGPLYVGLLNGLMPCGPLQAMQLFALSTASPLRGGFAMLAFAAGTLPLTMGLGVAGAYLGRRFLSRAIQAGAVLVLIMGFGMLGNGLRLSGFAAPGLADEGAVVSARTEAAGQTVVTELAPGAYQPIRVRVGLPLRWNLHAGAGTLNGCNNRIVIPEYGIEKKLALGDNLIEFTPDRAGVFPYVCWMGMIHSRIIAGDAEDNGGAGPVDPALLPAPDEDYAEKLPWEEDS